MTAAWSVKVLFYSLVVLPSGKELTHGEKETDQESEWKGQEEDYPLCVKLHSSKVMTEDQLPSVWSKEADNLPFI